MIRKLGLLILLVALVTGCSPGEKDAGPAAKTLEGKPDARFAGVWKTENGASTYTFAENGDYDLKAKITTPGGAMDTESQGSWSVKGDTLFIKDPAGNIVPYEHDLQGDRLSLTLAGSSLQNKTVLLRQKGQ
ncbi:MAG: hypothetical protein KIS66_12185 [Fimbriimonadaceae bacterium]|nr:hypothetical protein [Fimbriimonadaceae bacterium]